jgi:hypothetical protein
MVFLLALLFSITIKDISNLFFKWYFNKISKSSLGLSIKNPICKIMA